MSWSKPKSPLEASGDLPDLSENEVTPGKHAPHPGGVRQPVLETSGDFGRALEEALSTPAPSWSKPITDWQRETFGTPSVTVAFERAREEWAEMFDGFHEDWSPEEQAEEAADVVITLAAFVRALGFDLAKVVERKMAKNRARKWVTRGDGTGDHVKEGEES